MAIFNSYVSHYQRVCGIFGSKPLPELVPNELMSSSASESSAGLWPARSSACFSKSFWIRSKVVFISLGHWRTLGWEKKMEHAAGTHWRWQKTVAFGTHFAIWSDQKFPPMGWSIQRGLKPKKKHPGTDPKKTAFLSGRQHVENHLDAFRIHQIGIGTTKDEVPPGRQVQDVRFLLLPLEPLSRWEISGGSSPIYQLVDYIDGPFQQTKNSKSCKHIQNQPWIRSDTVAKNRISKTLALRNRTTQVVSFSWGPTITARETLWAFEATSWYSE